MKLEKARADLATTEPEVETNEYKNEDASCGADGHSGTGQGERRLLRIFVSFYFDLAT